MSSDGISAVGMTALLVNRSRHLESTAAAPLYVDAISPLFGMPAEVLERLEAAQAEVVKANGGKPEAPPYVTMGTRTWWFDQKMREACAAGVRQVVTLGSGLDCRALRLALPEDTRFVEVDEAAVLDWKIAKLAEHGQQYPEDRTTFLRGNYLKDLSLLDELERAGVRPSEPVFVLWEGNTMYLPTQPARDLLRDLLRRFPFSRVAFDYLRKTDAASFKHDARVDVFMRCAAPDGSWLFQDPWDHAQAQPYCGYDLLEHLDFPGLLRLARGDALAAQLLNDFPALATSALAAIYGFCLVKPANTEEN